MDRIWLAGLALALSAVSTQGFAQDAAGERRATQLIGAQVESPGGEALGVIEELLIEPERARVYGAVLAYGGVLGVAKKAQLVPMSELRMDRDGTLTTPLSPERLAEAPGIVGVERHTQFLRASRLIGREVVDPGGESRGEIDDLVIAMGTGAVKRVVLEYDEARGLGSVPLSVPPGQISLTPADRPVVLGSTAPVQREGFEMVPSDERKRLMTR